MIDVLHVRKRLGQEDILRDLSFHVLPNRICAFLGHNGVGKTTSLKMLCGLLAPDSGAVRIARLCPYQNRKKVAQLLAYLPEEPIFYRDLQVNEQLDFVGKLAGLSSRELRVRRDELLERCSLTSHAHILCSQLSRGFRQRLGLAQALLHDPQVLLLDEPSSGLDPSQSIEFRRLIKELSLKKTVLLSTHNLTEARSLCDEILLLHNGHIALHAKTKDIPEHLGMEELFLQYTRGEHFSGSAQVLNLPQTHPYQQAGSWS